MSAPLNRVAFETSRALDFVGTHELTAQIGHGPDEWLLVILKELVDNALDEAEEAGTAPQISIAVDSTTGTVSIADNGRGLPARTITRLLDFSTRISSREAYASPSRGQQGNALKTILAMPFALDGERGETLIESKGQAHRIVFAVDRVRREPRISRTVTSLDVQIGTKITVYWPSRARHLLVTAANRFAQMAATFTTLNPHLTIRVRWDDKEFLDTTATAPAWSKWKTSDPTSAHWYTPQRFERYIAAHIARDQDRRRPGRTVRDFIAELRGLSRSSKQALVLADTGTSGIQLADYFARGPAAVAALLDACRRHTQPVKPEMLGLIGADHLHEDRVAMGGAPASFRYKKLTGTNRAGLPFVLEGAFAYRPGKTDGRWLVTGINFSAGISNPFDRLGLGSLLAEGYASSAAPVVFVLHYTCPVIDFADRGKGSLAPTGSLVSSIGELVGHLLSAWTKQRRREVKSAQAEDQRADQLLRERTRPARDPRPEPTGILADIIVDAAEELESPLDTLAVLSPANDPYLAWRHRREAEWFARWFDRLVPPPAKKHLRGLFYLLVTRPDATGPDGKTFVNDYAHWQIVLSASKAARWLGLVPPERIIDERNSPPEIFVPSPGPVTASVTTGEGCTIPASPTLPGIALNGFVGRQPCRIVFYGEKSSLGEVLRPIAEQTGAEMILATGESSDTLIAGMAQRAADDGRPAVVLYFSDFDPSGHEMPANVARKLMALRDLYHPDLNVKLYPVALTIEQVRTLSLPSSPLKATERRAAKWRQAMGHEQTEIDALVELHPDALRRAVYDAIRPFYDAGLNNRVFEAEQRWRDEAGRGLARPSRLRRRREAPSCGLDPREGRQRRHVPRAGSARQHAEGQAAAAAAAPRGRAQGRSAARALRQPRRLRDQLAPPDRSQEAQRRGGIESRQNYSPQRSRPDFTPAPPGGGRHPKLLLPPAEAQRVQDGRFFASDKSAFLVPPALGNA